MFKQQKQYLYIYKINRIYITFKYYNTILNIKLDLSIENIVTERLTFIYIFTYKQSRILILI